MDVDEDSDQNLDNWPCWIIRTGVYWRFLHIYDKYPFSCTGMFHSCFDFYDCPSFISIYSALEAVNFIFYLSQN